MFRQRIITTLLTVIVALVASGGVSFADMPHVVSYQGKVADGSYAMRFRIYDAVTGGTLLWDSGVQTVTVTAGVFSVLLGQSPQPVLGLAFDADYWLAVTFSGVDQTPRQRLASTGYAYMASGLVPGTRIRGAVPGGSSPAPEGYGAVLAAVNTRKSGSAIGIYGASSSSVGTGVYGEATATGGVGCGVVGWAYCLGGQFVSPSPLGIGVHGVAGALDGEPYGGLFESWAPSGRGVVGTSYATSGVASGVVGIGWSTGGRGVLGSVLATSGTTYGGRFHSMSSSGIGVYGYANSETGTTYGVYGGALSTSGHGVYYQGGLAGTGTKSCVVKTSQGPTLMYCQESPENWFEDFGERQLVNGRCQIELDPLFLETVTIDAANPMKVYVTPNGRLGEWWVEKGVSGFTIVSLGEANGTTFDYRVVAKRKGFETRRLDYCAAAERDSYLYPELREKELREIEDERARREEESSWEEERRRGDEERAPGEEDLRLRHATHEERDEVKRSAVD